MLKSKDSIDKKKYRIDALPYALVIFGLVFNAFYFITLYTNNQKYYYTFLLGLSVIYNLVFMLLVFFGAEEIKHYRRRYAIMLFIIGILQIARIFIYPKLAYEANQLSSKSHTWMIIYLIISCVFLVTGAIISFINTNILKRYIAGKLTIPQSEEV